MIKNPSGFTLIAVVAAILILTVMGLTLISQVGTGITSTGNEQAASQAAYISEGGQELSLRYLGDNPFWGGNLLQPNASSFSDMAFGDGSFTVFSSYPLTAIATGGAITISSTTVNVNSTAVFPSSGILRIESECMSYTGKTATSFTGITRGTNGTAAAAHTEAMTVYPATILSSAVTAAATTIPVSSTTGFLSSGTIKIENELVDYAGKTAASFTNVTRGTHATTAASHAVSLPVWPGVLQCEITTTGTVGTSGQPVYGVRSFQQTVINSVLGSDSFLITTLAGTGTAGFSGEGGQAALANINNPERLTINSTGTLLYFADTSNHRIRRVDLTTGIITTVAGNGTACATPTAACGDGGAATSANLNTPRAVELNPLGTILYIADSGDRRVRQVNLSTGVITAFAGTGGNCTGSSTCGDGGAATSATFGANGPQGLTVDSTGIVYIVDPSRNRVRKVSSGTISHVAGATNGTAGNVPSAGTSSTLTAARFSAPEGIAIHPTNNNILYLADVSNHKIRLINISAVTVTTVAGTGTASFTGDGGVATSATISSPNDVTVDSQGNILIADSANNRIRMVIVGSDSLVNAGTGELISTIAGDGTTVYDGDSIDPVIASLSLPSGIIFNPVVSSPATLQDYYVSDSSHQRIRKIAAPNRKVVIEEVDWNEKFN